MLYARNPAAFTATMLRLAMFLSHTASSMRSLRIPHAAPMSQISAQDVLRAPQWPPTWPFTAEDFRRVDETPDADFYSQPRFVYHIDEHAVGVRAYSSRSLSEVE
jgi:hypothetical protein